MSREIRINYNEVYTKTAELRQRIQGELNEMETSYRQANASLSRMDSRTNAVLIEAMDANRIKAQVTCETLNKLLAFIDSSAKQIERDEQMITRAFTMSRVAIRREEGGTA